jgi:hypothetical protein
LITPPKYLPALHRARGGTMTGMSWRVGAAGGTAITRGDYGIMTFIQGLVGFPS